MGGSDAPVILVVEDDASLRMLCRVNLELEGFRVIEAGTISRAREVLETETPSVVLLDLHVGDEYGLDLVPLLRGERPDARICLLSGTSETDPPLLPGVHAFIRKPFELDDLVATIRRLTAIESARP